MEGSGDGSLYPWVVESEDLHPALRRVLRDQGDPELLATIGERLSGSDLTTLLLAVADRRAATTSPNDVLRQYACDRFVTPGQVDAVTLADVEAAALQTVARSFEPVVISPVVPFAAHSSVAGVAQDNVLTTYRASEVAADPTMSLALEAALRRQGLQEIDPRSADVVRLAAADRVVRAQRFAGERSFSHFSLLGLVSAGRDRGSRRFERDELIAHVQSLVAVIRSCLAPRRTAVRLTDFGDESSDVVEACVARLSSPETTCEVSPEREAARGYYPGVCFKLAVDAGDELVEVGDGGFVDWTQHLLGNRKERLMTSGLSLERVAMLASEA